MHETRGASQKKTDIDRLDTTRQALRTESQRRATLTPEQQATENTTRQQNPATRPYAEHSRAYREQDHTDRVAGIGR